MSAKIISSQHEHSAPIKRYEDVVIDAFPNGYAQSAKDWNDIFKWCEGLDQEMREKGLMGVQEEIEEDVVH